MTDILIIAIILIIIASASFYIYKSKKGGKKCIGCPHSNDCFSKNDCCSYFFEKK